MKVREAIALAAHVATSRATLPILATVRLNGERLVATDLTQQVEIPIEVPRSLAKADICVNAARLTKVLKALPEDRDVEFEAKGQRLFITAGPTRYELNTLPAADFPALQPPASAEALTIALPAKDFAAALKFVAPAMAFQDIRYYLCGMHVTTAPGRITFTATNGHCLHRATLTLEPDPAAQNAEAIVAHASIARILDIAGRHKDVTLTIHGQHLTVEHDEALSTKLIEGKFPDAERVIPRDRQATGAIQRGAFAAALKRVALIRTSDEGVRLTFTADAIELAVRNADDERAIERFAWTVAIPEFKSHESGFDCAYLLAAVEAFTTNEVFVHLAENAEQSLYLTDGDAGTRQVVIMPMRL